MDNITREKIDDIVMWNLTSDHDGFINGRSEVIDQVWSIIEALQKENEILKLEKEIEMIETISNIQCNNCYAAHFNARMNLAELETKLKQLKKS